MDSLADWESRSYRNATYELALPLASLADWESRSYRNGGQAKAPDSVSLADWESRSYRNTQRTGVYVVASLADWESRSYRNVKRSHTFLRPLLSANSLTGFLHDPRPRRFALANPIGERRFGRTRSGSREQARIEYGQGKRWQLSAARYRSLSRACAPERGFRATTARCSYPWNGPVRTPGPPEAASGVQAVAQCAWRSGATAKGG